MAYSVQYWLNLCIATIKPHKVALLVAHSSPSQEVELFKLYSRDLSWEISTLG